MYLQHALLPYLLFQLIFATSPILKFLYQCDSYFRTHVTCYVNKHTPRKGIYLQGIIVSDNLLYFSVIYRQHLGYFCM